MSAEAVPTHVGPYDILAVIGSGGMGTVYKGFQASLNRIVAIKVLPARFVHDPERVERFHREAQAVALLSHPNIVQIIDKGREGDLLYFVMEYIEGPSLDAVLQKGRLSLPEILRILKEVAKALQFSHASGIIHRDLKPRNVLLTSDLSTVKLTDFGISRIESLSRAAGTLTTANASLGTLFYFSPEQAEDSGKVDHRTDIYSLGVIFYEMLTGKVPVGKFHLPSELNPELSPEVDAVVLKCLAYDRNQRYPDVQAFLVDIERLERSAGLTLLDELRGFSRLKGRLMPRSDPQHAGRRSGLIAVLLLVAAIVAGGAIFLAKGWSDRDQTEAASNGQSAVEPTETAPSPSTNDSPNAAGSSSTEKGAAVEPANAGTTAPGASSAPEPQTIEPQPAAAPATTETGAQKPGANTQPGAPAPVAKGSAPLPKPSATSPPPAVSAPAAPDPKVPKVDLAARDLASIRTTVAAGQYDQALTEIQGFFSRYPDHALALDAHLLEANVFERQNRAADAARTYQTIGDRFASDPRAAGALYRLAQLSAARSGGQAEGRRLFGQVANDYPDGQWAVPALKAKAAIEERSKLKERDPILLQTVPAQLMTYRQLVEKHPSDPSAEVAFWKLGEMYEDVERFDLAASAFSGLGTNFPQTSYDAWFRAGELYDRKIKDRAAARSAYARVPRGSRNYDEAQKRASRLAR